MTQETVPKEWWEKLRAYLGENFDTEMEMPYSVNIRFQTLGIISRIIEEMRRIEQGEK